MKAVKTTTKPYHEVLTRTAPPAELYTRRFFTSLRCEGPAIKPRALLDAPTMIVSSHRSHMDYILLGIHCSRLGYRNLRFAAGDNLIGLPFVGRKFTALGAFPIERDHSTSREYVAGLCERVVRMLDDGDTIIVFPEGGRSYTGAMQKMKRGLIAANIIARCRSAQVPHYYLPFAVSYEVPPEIHHLRWIDRGRRLRKGTAPALDRTVGNLLYYGADLAAFARFALAPSFGVQLGDVYLDYGEPFEVGSVVETERACAADTNSALFTCADAARQMSVRVHGALVRLYRILPVHVVAWQLKLGRSLTDDLASRIPETVCRLRQQGRNCRTLGTLSGRDILGIGSDCLASLGAVRARGGALDVANASIIDYYARTIGDAEYES